MSVACSPSRAGRRGPADAHGHLAERVDPLAQRARHDLDELGHRRHGGLAEHRVGRPGELAQTDRHGDRLVVVEQQRRQPAAGAEGVAAVAAGGALDRVAEVAQPGHVAPQGARRDLQPVRQIRPLTRTNATRTGRAGGAGGPVCRCAQTATERGPELSTIVRTFVVVTTTRRHARRRTPVHFMTVDTAWQLAQGPPRPLHGRGRPPPPAAPAAARGSPPRSRRAGSRRLSRSRDACGVSATAARRGRRRAPGRRPRRAAAPAPSSPAAGPAGRGGAGDRRRRGQRRGQDVDHRSIGRSRRPAVGSTIASASPERQRAEHRRLDRDLVGQRRAARPGRACRRRRRTGRRRGTCTSPCTSSRSGISPSRLSWSSLGATNTVATYGSKREPWIVARTSPGSISMSMTAPSRA